MNATLHITKNPFEPLPQPAEGQELTPSHKAPSNSSFFSWKGLLTALLVFMLGSLVFAQIAPREVHDISYRLKPEPNLRFCTPSEPVLHDLSNTDWIQPLSSNPPRPKPIPINKNAALQWINAHVGNRARNMAKLFIETIRYIPQSEFEEALRCSVQDFNEKIAGSDFIAVSLGLGKSGFWATSLALPHLKNLPTDVADVSDLERALKRHPHVNQVAIFDDAIYSGKQMEVIVRDVHATFYSMFPKRDFKIHIIAPFQVDKIRILYRFDPNKVIVANYQRLTLIKELIPEEDETDFEAVFGEQNNSCMYWRSKPLVYFDHKIPDNCSSFPNELQGGRLGIDISSLLEKALTPSFPNRLKLFIEELPTVTYQIDYLPPPMTAIPANPFLRVSKIFLS